MIPVQSIHLVRDSIVPEVLFYSTTSLNSHSCCQVYCYKVALFSFCDLLL